MSQDEFAQMLGTSKQVLSRYEIGQRIPKITQVREYAKRLNVSADYLMGDSAEEAAFNSLCPKDHPPFYKIFLDVMEQMGLDNVARKGQSVGGTLPLGYRTGPDKRLEPDPKTAPLVRRIFEIYTAGNTQKEIIEHLNAEGPGSISVAHPPTTPRKQVAFGAFSSLKPSTFSLPNWAATGRQRPQDLASAVPWAADFLESASGPHKCCSKR